MDLEVGRAGAALDCGLYRLKQASLSCTIQSNTDKRVVDITTPFDPRVGWLVASKGSCLGRQGVSKPLLEPDEWQMGCLEIQIWLWQAILSRISHFRLTALD